MSRTPSGFFSTPRVIARAATLATLILLGCGAADASPRRVQSPNGGQAPLEAAISVDGPTVWINAKKPGRLVRLAFDAEAGERLGLGISVLELSPKSASALVVGVRGPDDALVPMSGRVHCFVASASRPQGNCDGEFTVTRSGRHVIEVDTPFSATARFKALLSRPAMAKLAPDREETVILKRAGQDARLELAADAGGDVSVNVRDATPGRSEGAFTLRVFRADGTLVAESDGSAQRGASVPVKDDGGTYIVEVDPAHGAHGAFVVSARAAPQLALDGLPVAFGSANSSDVVRFALAAKAGQSVVVAIDGLAHTPDADSNSRIALLTPDGTRLGFTSCLARPLNGLRPQPCKVLAANLPVSGRYTVEVTPPMRASVSGRLLATEVVSGTIAPGTPLTLGAMKRGQVARYAFAASAGQRAGVQLANLSASPAGTTVSVSMRPMEGFGMSAMRVGREGTVSIPPTALRNAGTYVVVIDPGLGSVQSGELSLTIDEGKSQ